MKTLQLHLQMLMGLLLITSVCFSQALKTGKTMKTEQKKNGSESFKSGHSLVNGLNMYYEIHGEGKPLVLIHGGGSTIETTFGRVLSIFAQHHKVIAVELQAHGRTPDRDKPSSFEQDADDVAALLKNLNISKADIFGFSNGGTTALQIAIRHPQLVDKLIAASTIYKKAGAHSFIWEFIQKGTFNDMPQEFKDAYLAVNPSKDGLMQMFKRDNIRMLNFNDISDNDIASIKAKTLILMGDKDVTTLAHVAEMNQLIANSSIMVLPGGHGAYIGEITTLKQGSKIYPQVAILIEEFLSGK